MQRTCPASMLAQVARMAEHGLIRSCDGGERRYTLNCRCNLTDPHFFRSSLVCILFFPHGLAIPRPDNLYKPFSRPNLHLVNAWLPPALYLLLCIASSPRPKLHYATMEELAKQRISLISSFTSSHYPHLQPCIREDRNSQPPTNGWRRCWMVCLVLVVRMGVVDCWIAWKWPPSEEREIHWNIGQKGWGFIRTLWVSSEVVTDRSKWFWLDGWYSLAAPKCSCQRPNTPPRARFPASVFFPSSTKSAWILYSSTLSVTSTKSQRREHRHVLSPLCKRH